MKSVRILAETLDLPSLGSDRWYVTNGSTAVGPIELDLVARGIEAGKVPLDGFIRHEAWKVWRPLHEVAVVGSDEGPGAGTTDDITLPGRPPLVDETTPSDAVAGAADLRDALLLLLTAAIQKTASDVAMIHEVLDDGAVVVAAHGPQMFDVLGDRARVLDAVALSAAGGSIVVAEPTPGPAGEAMIARLAKLGPAPMGAFMIPIRPHGRLFGMLEIGRSSTYRAREIAEVEALVDALVAKVESLAWA